MNEKIKRSSPLVSWVLNSYGYSSPEKWILDQVHKLLSEAKQLTPPINLEALCSQRHISVVYKNDIPDATLRVENNKFIAEVRQTKQYSKRWRFSIAHEIAHTFFYDLSRVPIERVFHRYSAYEDEERLCDIAASEILMPETLIKQLIKYIPKPGDSNFSLQIFLNLLKKFNVSADAMARRLCEDLNIWNSIIMGSRWLSKNSSSINSEFTDSPKWRLEWYYAPKEIRKQLYIPSINTHPRMRFKIIEEAYQLKKPTINSEPISNFKLGNLSKVIKQIAKTKTEHRIYATPISMRRTESSQLTLYHNDKKIEKEIIKPAHHQKAEVIICIPLANI
jgi:Zn-dependent peptidase ImmA (M78 family)